MTAAAPSLMERVAYAIWDVHCAHREAPSDYYQEARAAVAETLAALRESGRLVDVGTVPGHVKDALLATTLRFTTSEMATHASVDMELWNRHSNACLDAANAIERLSCAPPATAATEGE